MKKELKDYAHFYIGCDILQDDNEIARLVGIYAETCMLIHEATGQFGECDISKIKLILRPLSDIKSTEYDIWASFTPDYSNDIRASFAEIKVDGKRTSFLLSKKFDLFDLIPSELAIDAITLKQKS